MLSLISTKQLRCSVDLAGGLLAITSGEEAMQRDM